jgi:hypothetical protein
VSSHHADDVAEHNGGDLDEPAIVIAERIV